MPQAIRPVLQRLFILDEAVVSWPHPLLCGRDGIITTLPDHMHEGDCVVPSHFSDEAEQFGRVEGSRPSVFRTYRTVEYPRSADGQRVVPEFVARSAITVPGREGETFGAIAAYDGHRANVGRVAVDSTFHHFINGNLVPYFHPDLGLARLAERADELVRVRRALEDYYRNVAFWLAPPAKLQAMAGSYVWYATTGQVLAEEVPRSDPAAHDPWDVGALARNVLGRATTRCQEMAILGSVLLPKVGGDVIIGPSPWSREAVSGFKGPRLLDPDFLLNAALGGAMLAVVEHVPVSPMKPPPDISAEDFSAIITAGSRQGLKRAVEALRGASEHLQHQTDQIEAALQGE